MRVFVLCNSDLLGFPLIARLNERKDLCGIGILKRYQKHLMPGLKSMGIEQKDIHAFSKADWIPELEKALRTYNPDVVWVLTFPWKIPASLLRIPAQGFVNFHFGLLPKYKGIDPIFWHIKNKDSGGLTIHLMNESIDEGPIVFQEQINIVPGENYGLYAKRMGEQSAGFFDRILEVLEQKPMEFLQLASSEVIDKKPGLDDITIDWKNQSADDIEWTVNACNPKYGGAWARLGGEEVQLVEVTPINLANPVEVEPGQIVHADATYGVVVACKNNGYLRITVARLSHGFVSGVRLFNMGILPGQKFES